MVSLALVYSHWGDAQTWTQNPGSLYFHNTVLDRKPIVVTSPPPYRTCRDLIFFSLYARIFHCLRLVSGCSSLEEYASAVTFEQLCQHAGEIIAKFANPSVVAELREARKDRPDTDGDMTFENAVLFLQDALLMRAFTDTIKRGDSGQILVILKVLALSFRGTNRTKYAHETLHLIHNIEHVWPAKLRYGSHYITSLYL